MHKRRGSSRSAFPCLSPVGGSPIKANPTAPTTKSSTFLHFAPHVPESTCRPICCQAQKGKNFKNTRSWGKTSDRGENWGDPDRKRAAFSAARRNSDYDWERECVSLTNCLINRLKPRRIFCCWVFRPKNSPQVPKRYDPDHKRSSVATSCIRT